MKKAPQSGSDQSVTVIIERILSSSAVAKKAFEKLEATGMSRSDLALTLCMIPNLPNKLSPMVRAKTERTTKNFPAKLEGLADEIEDVNERGWLLYRLQLDAYGEALSRPIKLENLLRKRASYQEILDDFRRLPQLVRAYAAYLKSAIRDRRSRDHLQKFAVIRLLERVRRSTGRCCYPEIGCLCEAAFDAAGRSKPSYLQNLHKLYRNNPRLHAAPYNPPTKN